jgi:hypothetical protein
MVYTEKIRTANVENGLENQQLKETMVSCDDQSNIKDILK